MIKLMLIILFPFNPAKATTESIPTIEDEIVPAPELRNKSTSLNKKRNSEKMIGKWIAQGYGGVYYLVLYESHGKIYLAMRDSQSSIETEMIIQNKHGRNIYVEKDGNQFGEYYVINIDGYLEVYDYQGYILLAGQYYRSYLFHLRLHLKNIYL